jgi:glycosyltransferase 2 family protein
VRLSRRPPAAAASSAPDPANSAHPAEMIAGLVVEDHLEPRVRLPADILRCITACIEIAIVVGLALLAKATAKGVEVDLFYASRRLATGITTPLAFIGTAAILVMPVLVAGWLIFLGQLRRVIEAALIGLAGAGVTLACNGLLGLSPLAGLLHALGKASSQSVGVPLDAYLAGLVAYITVLGMSGMPRWRTVFWLAIGFYCLASVASSNGQNSVLTLLISLLIGRAAGTGLRYATGTTSQRPTAAEIAAALSANTSPVVEIRRVPDASTDNRTYATVQRDGGRLDVTVFDRDQQAADAIYGLYRGLRLRSQVSGPSPLTVERAIERRALMTYAVEDAGVSTPRLRAVLRVGPEAAVTAVDHHAGQTLTDLPEPPSDDQIGRIFDAVLRLHQHRVTHRALTADHILLTGNGSGPVMLLEPGGGEVAATDLQVRLDLAQLTATLALLVGPDRAADAAREKIGKDVASLVPLLQPVALHRSTRTALRQHREVLPALRKRLVGSVPASDLPPEQLERFRPRTVVTLVASIFAAYIVIGQLGRVSFAHVLRTSDPRWIVAAVALTAVTYFGATWSLTGFVVEKLHLFRTFMVQLAGSFVTLVTPAAVGGVALNIRYLQKSDVEPADAAASVGVSQVFAFGLHISLLVIFAALTGTTHTTSFRPPGWVYIALGVLGGAVLVVLSIPAGRRLARSRLAPALGQVIPRLLDIAQRPVKLTEGIGGAFLVTSAYILCLEVCVLAVGGHASLAAIAVVFLTGNALGSAVPTPGGLGAVEAALTAGLKLAGLPGAAAVSAVLLFRLITFWLPVPFGWFALSYSQRRGLL